MKPFKAMYSFSAAGRLQSTRKILIKASCLTRLPDCPVLELDAAGLGNLFGTEAEAVSHQLF